MEGMNPWLAGAALAISFAACTLVFVAYPDAAVEFLNASFHGLEFRKLQPAAGGFSLAGFGTVIVVWALVGLLVGALYAAIRNLQSALAVRLS